jgi:hypothetical protein
MDRWDSLIAASNSDDSYISTHLLAADRVGGALGQLHHVLPELVCAYRLVGCDGPRSS